MYNSTGTQQVVMYNSTGTPGKLSSRGGLTVEEGAINDDDDGINKRPVWAAMAMAMAMAMATVAVAAGRWQPQLRPQPHLQW